MTYREMFNLLKEKGIHVEEDHDDLEPDGEEGLMKYWAVRTRDFPDEGYLFYCGFDLLGDGYIAINRTRYPVNDNVFETLMTEIKTMPLKSHGVMSMPQSSDDILLVPDLSFYNLLKQKA